jgi:hypothetical protein
MNSGVRCARIWVPRQGLPGQAQLAAKVEVVWGDLKSESLSGRFADLSADSVSTIRLTLVNEDVLFSFDSRPLDRSAAYFDKCPYKGKLWRILNLSPAGAFEAKARQAGRVGEESDSSSSAGCWEHPEARATRSVLP